MADPTTDTNSVIELLGSVQGLTDPDSEYAGLLTLGSSVLDLLGLDIFSGLLPE